MDRLQAGAVHSCGHGTLLCHLQMFMHSNNSEKLCISVRMCCELECRGKGVCVIGPAGGGGVVWWHDAQCSGQQPLCTVLQPN